MLRDFWKWLVDVCRAWYGWVGGSATMGIVGLGQILELWPAPPKWLYYAFLAVGLLISVFQAWRMEYRQRLEIERKHLDEQPRFFLRAKNFGGDEETWHGRMDSGEPLVEFYLDHYGGRNPEDLRFDPIASLAGQYSLRIFGIPFATSAKGGGYKLRHEIWIVGADSDSHDAIDILKKLGPNRMLNQFVGDRPKGLAKCSYFVRVRYYDRGEERTKDFVLEFNTRRYEFQIKAHEQAKKNRIEMEEP